MTRLKGKHVRVRRGQWHYRFMVKGEAHSGSTGLDGVAENRKAAERFAADEQRRAEQGQLKEQQEELLKPFDKAAGEYVTWCETVRYRAKPNTWKRIDTSLRSAVDFFSEKPVKHCGAAALEKYKAYRFEVNKVKDITVRHDLHALSGFYKYAIKQGWIDQNPLARNQSGEREVNIPSDAEAIRENVLSAKQEKAYFEAADRLYKIFLKSHPNAQPNMSDLARLMLDQGMRPEEMAVARKEAFNPKAATLYIAGGKSRAARRTLDLTKESVAILKRRMELEGPWLFPSERYPEHHITKLNNTHERICLEAGIVCVIYDFRHTFATRFYEVTKDIALTAKVLGHANLRSVMRYVHVDGEAQKKARENFEAAKRRRKFRVV